MSVGVAYTLTVRCQIDNRPGMLGRLTTRIGEVGGDIGAIDIVRAERNVLVRDITVRVQDEQHGETLIEELNAISGITVLQVSDRVFLAHLGGKLAMQSKVPLKNRDDLSLAYTPGVARVCRAIADDPEKAFSLTWKTNSVAVVSDGSAILGLGNLGPEAAMPVMEGKAILFKELADIDAVPICLRSQHPELIVQTVEQIAAGFGGINLEDIAAPSCFLVEGRLHESLNIPVMHDDQHGTAVVVLAALRNALRVVGKDLREVRAVVNGVGAAGTAIIRALLEAHIGEVTAVDRYGILCEGDDHVQTTMQRIIASQTNRERRRGTLGEAIRGADVFVGVSKGGVLTPELVRSMAPDPIVFALANPVPEGDPEMLRAYARVVATGRSDQPNQINNVLSFPGIFRGALDVNAAKMTVGMRLAAAEALANVIPDEEISEEYIVPSVFNRAVVPTIATAVALAAIEEGVARRDHLPSRGGD
ncbi:ACT domain-containing protein [Candidatus Chloroploca sp. M-50]|uniref:ACT domain-containing protein n=1 Tax=Candidatus Chloroploca mongolica TaxID=2528176 RepID=A0ABS4D5B9_9CHLR|nr:malic enzyme-like NAD(P)-binding protein [Candidatus Chloroploca mongolica]MBP1464637.1 ACT domain-containing protein [Candidatus Chloroploca mongolica]